MSKGIIDGRGHLVAINVEISSSRRVFENSEFVGITSRNYIYLGKVISSLQIIEIRSTYLILVLVRYSKHFGSILR